MHPVMRKVATLFSLLIFAIASCGKANQNTKAELIVKGKMHTATIVEDGMTTV